MDKELMELMGLMEGLAAGVRDRLKSRAMEEKAAAEAPRLLKAVEIPTFDGAMILDYIDCEDWEREWALYKDEIDGALRFETAKWGVITLPLDEYGVDWRAWTGRTTKAQREAATWKRRAVKNAAAEAPRVLTAAEIPACAGKVYLEMRFQEDGDWARYEGEEDGETRFLGTRWDVIVQKSDNYGVYWRAWSGEPTKAQREAAPWQQRKETGIVTAETAQKARAKKLMEELSHICDEALGMLRETADLLRDMDEEADEPCGR